MTSRTAVAVGAEQARPVVGERSLRLARAVDSAVFWFIGHWVAGLLLLGALLTGLPIAAPLLEARGHSTLARGIYLFYRPLCHQRPERSFFIEGHKIAVCERCIAIYGASLALLAVYGVLRSTVALTPPCLLWPLLEALPMAVDGGTQLVGLRESTWQLRVITGVLFSLGAAWLALPNLDAGFSGALATMRARRAGDALSRGAEFP